jgi:hypothetical protein
MCSLDFSFSQNFYLSYIFQLMDGMYWGCWYIPVIVEVSYIFSSNFFPYAQSLVIAFSCFSCLIPQNIIHHQVSNQFRILFQLESGISFLLAGFSFFIFKYIIFDKIANPLTQLKKI